MVLITDAENKSHEDGVRLNGLSYVDVVIAAANDDDDSPHYDQLPTHYYRFVFITGIERFYISVKYGVVEFSDKIQA